MPGCCPPGTFGAGVARTGGVNKLPPVGLMLFSVGAAAPDVEGVVVVVAVVVVVVSGAFCSLAQAAVIAPIAMIAETPATAASRRHKRRESMVQSYLCRSMSIYVKTRRSNYCGESQELQSVPGVHKPAA
jgi:hypothetical protein